MRLEDPSQPGGPCLSTPGESTQRDRVFGISLSSRRGSPPPSGPKGRHGKRAGGQKYLTSHPRGVVFGEAWWYQRILEEPCRVKERRLAAVKSRRIQTSLVTNGSYQDWDL